jgi:N-acetylmuramoyl-L-alanine amidase
VNRFFSLAVLFCFAFCARTTHAAFINGQNYIPLADWARLHGLEVHWLKRGETVEATNHTTRLIFNADSAEVEINGVQVRLSFPVAVLKNVPLIAQFDLDTTIGPLLFSRFVEPKTIKTICLDPGHGGKDSGNRVGGHYEKNYTLPLAFELRDQLKKLGFKVVLTRSRDVYVDLPARPAIANKRGADLFISLHFNATATGRDEAEGPETYCITPVGVNSSNASGENGEFGSSVGTGPTVANRNESKSLLLAYQVEKSLVQNLNANDRGVKRARFVVLRDAAMPAILIEGGFMTHPPEAKKIYDTDWRRQLAAAIVKGVLDYQKLTAPPAVQPALLATNQPVAKTLTPANSP